MRSGEGPPARTLASAGRQHTAAGSTYEASHSVAADAARRWRRSPAMPNDSMTAHSGTAAAVWSADVVGEAAQLTAPPERATAHSATDGVGVRSGDVLTDTESACKHMRIGCACSGATANAPRRAPSTELGQGSHAGRAERVSEQSHTRRHARTHTPRQVALTVDPRAPRWRRLRGCRRVKVEHRATHGGHVVALLARAADAHNARERHEASRSIRRQRPGKLCVGVAHAHAASVGATMAWPAARHGRGTRTEAAQLVSVPHVT